MRQLNWISVGMMLILLSACSITDDDSKDTGGDIQYSITFIPVEKGLGDSSYTDSCYSAIYAKVLEHSLQLQLISPNGNITPENIIDTWWNYGLQTPNQKRLLILGDPSYGDILKEKGYETGVAGDILIVDSKDMELKAYTVSFSLYGACYLSGLLAGEKAFFKEVDFNKKAMLLLANPLDSVLQEAADGFRDGLWASCREEPNENYLSDEPGGGFTDYEATMKVIKTIGPQCRYIMPLIGGNSRILRTEAGPESNQVNIYYSGVDNNVINRNGRQLNYFCKNFRYVIGGFIDRWHADDMPALHQSFTLSNNGIMVEFGDVVYNEAVEPQFSNDYLNNLIYEAGKKEEEYSADN